MIDEWEIIPRNAFRNFFGNMDRELSQAEEMLNRVSIRKRYRSIYGGFI
jgi:hypothetical protein